MTRVNFYHEEIKKLTFRVGPSSEQCCFGLSSSVYFQLPVLNSFALARTVFGSFTKTITAIDLMARGIEFWFNTIKTDFLIAELEKIPVSSALLFQSVEKIAFHC